jgi:O-antigen/teichoic acid export membrane protein
MKIRGPAFLTATLATGQMIGLVRTFVVARFLGPEIQGEAVALGLITGFFAATLANNASWQLVQSKREDLADFQSSLHGAAIARGLFTSILMAAFGTFILNGISQGSLTSALYAIALVPFIEGFIHLDPWRALRDDRFKTLAILQFSGPLGSTISACIALFFIRDIWVIVIVMLCSTIFRVAVSHLVATHSWKAKLHTSHIREIIRFGLPLVPAGLMFWINTQSSQILMFAGDRIDSLPVFSDAEIGAYGTVAGIILLPRGTIVTVMQAIFIPKLARSIGQPEAFKKKFRWAVSGVFLLVNLIVVSGLIAGEAVFQLILGDKYEIGNAVAPLLVLAMGIQLYRTLCYETSIAVGKTSVHFVGNIFRLSSLGIAIVLLWAGKGVEGLAWSIVGGEILSTIASAIWLQITCVRHAWVTIIALTLTLVIALIVKTAQSLIGDLSILHRLLALATIYACIGGLAWLPIKRFLNQRGEAEASTQE